MARVFILVASILAPITLLAFTDYVESLTLTPNSTELLLGEKVSQELNCSAHENGDVDLKWKFGNSDVAYGKDINIFKQTKTDSNGTSVISGVQIRNFHAKYAGTYSCVLIINNTETQVESILLTAVLENKVEPEWQHDLTSATLSCSIETVNNKSVEEVTWYKVGWTNNVTTEDPVSKIDKDSRFTPISANNSLSISKPTIDDVGLYIARFNLVGDQVYKCRVGFQASPHVDKFDPRKKVIEGDNLILHCVVKGYPYSTVSWYKNGYSLNQSDGSIIIEKLFDEHYTVRLSINRTELIDAGDYTCEAYSEHFNQTHRQTISVRVIDVESLTLTPNSTELLLGEKVSQELNCSAHEKGSVDLKWKFGNIDVADGTDFSIFKQSKTDPDGTNVKSGVQIRNFHAKYAGTYSCVLIIDNAETQTKSILLTAVTENKVEPDWNHEMTSATLSCSIETANNKSVEEVTWYKVSWTNNKPTEDHISKIDKDSRFTPISANNSLNISKPTIDDVGLYIARFKLVDHQMYDCKVGLHASPSVDKFDPSKNLIEGDNLIINCVVKGYPYSTVSWYKNGHSLNNSDGRIVIDELFDKHHTVRLTIKRTEFNDAGEYTCEAYSEHFNQTHRQTISVRVKDKLAALWPFLGIVGEVVVLCTIIFIYEKRRNKLVQMEEKAAFEAETQAAEKKDGLRHRSTNPTA